MLCNFVPVKQKCHLLLMPHIKAKYTIMGVCSLFFKHKPHPENTNEVAIMFSAVSPSVYWGGGGRVPMWPLTTMHWTSLYRDPLNMGPHCTETPQTWDMTVQNPSPRHGTSLCGIPPRPPLDVGPNCTGNLASDIWWPRLETCSN